MQKTAELPGMVRAVGMPDLHPGQGCPVGAVFVTEGRIYPHLVGTDIGCGMSLWTTSIQQRRPERLVKKLRGLESGVETAGAWLENWCVEPCGFEHSLGTIGQGNHFAELLLLDEIALPERVNQIIDSDLQENALLLVHSGSRGYGEKILYEHTAVHQASGLTPDQPEFRQYMDQHMHALEWADLNRRVITDRILDRLGAVGNRILDVPHNFVEDIPSHSGVYIHRKGAIPSDCGVVVIPGSRGAHSYLVEPLDPDWETGYSLSHGAGRKMSRRDARVKFNIERDSIKRLERTKFGSVVVCEDREMLMEEAPEAYKPISRVIDDLVDHGLIRVLATMKPILTYKYAR